MRNIKTIIVSALVVIVVGGFIIYQNFFTGSPMPATNQTSAPKETINPNPQQTQTGYKDGQYTGTVATSVYGDVQVGVTISGGKITSIQMLKTPTAGGHTAELVASSFPILKSEAIAAQSANVNVVSGATQNSETFSQSLATALSQAS